MSSVIAEFDPSAAITGTFTITYLSNGIGILVIYNDSAWSLDLTFPDGSTDIAPAWLASIYSLSGPVGKVTWTQDKQVNMTQPDLSNVWVVAYRNNEKILGVYPAALTRQTKTGGGSVSSNADSIANDGNVAGTVFVESTPAGEGSSAISLTNDGAALFNILISGVYHQWLKTQASGNPLQLGQTGDVLELLGQLLVDQLATFTGNIVANGGINTNTIRDNVNGNAAMDLSAGTGDVLFDQHIIMGNNKPLQMKNNTGTAGDVLYLDAANETVLQMGVLNGNILLKNHDGTTLATLTSGNWHIDNIGCVAANLQLPVGGFSASNTGTVTVAGTTTVTVNHGLGKTPLCVLATCDTAGSTGTHSEHTYTSTQFSLLNGAGVSLTFRWWAFA